MSRELRILIAAFGDPGHTFPAIALARALRERGHRVVFETWEKWREVLDEAGVEFHAAEEYRVFAPHDGDGPAAGDAAVALLPLLEELRPDVVVNDILTLAPALAAERAGVPWATLIPHVFPEHEAGLPFFAFGGARLPRTALGRWLWTAPRPVLEAGLRRGRDELNGERAKVGLAPADRFHGGTSPDLALVATFPALEYPRSWPAHVHVTGPMEFETPYPDVEVPDGDGPLVLVAPSTAQDPECRLVRVALAALADEPVRVVATTNGHVPSEGIEVPANARLYGWLRYSQLMATGGRGRLPRRPWDGRPRARPRRAGPLLPRRRRHGGERRAGRLGGRRAVAAVAAAWASGRCALRCGGSWAMARSGSGRAASAHGREQHDGAAHGAGLVERFGIARR